MKVCIVGAGAIGGWIGARLAASDAADVSVVARGATLVALRDHGWRLQTDNALMTMPATVAEKPAELGEQDLVVVAVKSPSLRLTAEALAPLVGDTTIVLPLMNGVPWWFCQGSKFGDEPIQSVDPGGAISAVIPFEQVLGGVVHASCMRVEPGIVRHSKGNGLIIGEPSGGLSTRAEEVARVFSTAGFDVVTSPDVRHDIWYKLWGNMTMNPISALTGSTTDQILGDPLVRDFCSSVMREAAAIGEQLGWIFDDTPEDRHAVTAKLGAFKTSMLQDAEAGRPLELDALLGAVHEIGARVGVPTPSTGTLLGLSRLAARERGLYPRFPE